MTEIPIFLDGLIEGLNDSAIRAAREQIINMVTDLVALQGGDFTAMDKIVKDYAAAVEQIEGIAFPELNVEKIAFNYFLNMNSFNEKLAKLGDCETHACGEVVGDLIKTFLF
jgi:hypothetical protein